MKLISVLSLSMFLLGGCGIFISSNHLIGYFFGVEVMFLSVLLNLVVVSVLMNELTGHYMAIIVLTMSAVDIVVGLTLVVLYFRYRGNLSLDLFCLLKG